MHCDAEFASGTFTDCVVQLFPDNVFRSTSHVSLHDR